MDGEDKKSVLYKFHFLDVQDYQLYGIGTIFVANDFF